MCMFKHNTVTDLWLMLSVEADVEEREGCVLLIDCVLETVELAVELVVGLS